MPRPLRRPPPRPVAARPALLLPLACLLLGGCAAVAPTCGAATSPYPCASRAALATPGAVRVLDPYLGARLATLEARSPSLRAAMDRLRDGPVELVLATRAQSGDLLRGTSGARLRATAHTLGAAVTFSDPRSGVVSAVLVHVDVPAAARAARAAGGGDAGRDRLVEEVLVHEVWGHAVPVALAAHVRAACADPRPDQPAATACVIRRENELRRELGWALRDQYALVAPRRTDA